MCCGVLSQSVVSDECTMQRRQYLAAAVSVSALGLAGCSGDTGGNNSSNGSGGGETEMSGDAETATGGEDTTTASAETEVGTDAGMGTEEGTTAGAEDTATAGSENESEATETQMETATASGNETAGGNESASGNGSASGNESAGGSASITDSGDTDVTLQSADVADAYSLDSVAFYSEDMSSGVRGEVTNTSDSSISYTGIQVKFYDSEGTRLGETLDNASDLGAGKTYAFDAVSLLTGDKLDSIASYTITVSDSAL